MGRPGHIFINLQRRQPLDVFPSLWGKVGELMDDGTIISSQEVYDEIMIGGDDLEKWARARQKCFLPSDIPVQQDVRAILSTHRGLIEGGKKKNSADPFVIALAKQQNRELFQVWLQKLAQWHQTTTPYLFLHTPDIAQAPELVHILWEDLRKTLPEIGAVPAIPQQSSLF